MDTRHPPSNADRRSQPRAGAADRLRGGLFGVLRLIERNVRGFYAAVGVFLFAGLAVVMLGAAAFARIANAVVEGQTESFDRGCCAGWGASARRS